MRPFTLLNSSPNTMLRMKTVKFYDFAEQKTVFLSLGPFMVALLLASCDIKLRFVELHRWLTFWKHAKKYLITIGSFVLMFREIPCFSKLLFQVTHTKLEASASFFSASFSRFEHFYETLQRQVGLSKSYPNS